VRVIFIVFTLDVSAIENCDIIASVI